MTETESSIDEQARGLLTQKTGLLADETDTLQRFLKINRNILNFYSNEYGLHLEPDQQNRFATLVHQCDLLVLDTSRLEFSAKNLETEAYKALLQKNEFSPDQKTVSELTEQLNQTKKQLLQLNDQIRQIVRQFHQKQDA